MDNDEKKILEGEDVENKDEVANEEEAASPVFSHEGAQSEDAMFGHEAAVSGIIPGLIDRDVTAEVRTAFLDYSMSVIVSRAIPDVRDGFKPVQRRIIFGMKETNMLPSKPHMKCARIVGDVMGKYHPHGDAALYGTLVRLAQPFSLRYTLVDGHGNYGSIDGDEAAAMRYTEARMSKLSLEMVRDYGAVALNVLALEVVQQRTALTYQHHQGPFGRMIFTVGLDMLRQMGNTVGEQGYLALSGTSIRIGLPVLAKDLLLLLSV